MDELDKMLDQMDPWEFMRARNRAMIRQQIDRQPMNFVIPLTLALGFAGGFTFACLVL